MHIYTNHFLKYLQSNEKLSFYFILFTKKKSGSIAALLKC